MTLYSVRILSPSGNTATLAIDAHSVEAVRQHPTLARQQIVSVRRHWQEWLGLRRTDPNEQRLLLMRMASQLMRGRLSATDLEQIIDRLPSLRRNRRARPKYSLTGLAPHEILLHLNCHPFAIALCREGEQLGQVPELLLQGAQFLEQQRHIKKQLHGPLFKSCLYLGTTLGLLIVTPLLFQTLLDNLATRVVIQTNLATEILSGLNMALTDFLPLTLAALVAMVALGRTGWVQLRRWPVVQDFDGLIRARRASVLLSVLIPSFRKGVHLADLMRSLSPLLGRRASHYLYTQLNTGHRLSQSLTETYFSETLVVGLSQFEDVPDTRLPTVFDTVKSNLEEEISWRLERIVRVMQWLYMGLLMGLLLLLIQGFLVPLYSISVT